MSLADVAAPVARRLEDLPSPAGLPVLGNLLQIDLPRFHQQLEAWTAELGPIFTLRLGRKRVLVIAEAELLQTVLRERPERYRRLAAIESVLQEIGANGVFSVEGEAWRPQRQLVMRALVSTHFRGFFPTLQRITERLHRRWIGAAERGETVDMTHDLTRYTVDVTTALAFGEDPNTIEGTGDVIQNHLALVFPTIYARINAPLPLWRYLKLPKDRRFDRALAAIHAHVQTLIEHARTRMRDEPTAAPRNLLEAMLAARDAPDSGLTDADVTANVQTLLLAGEDTTAHTLAWTLLFLAGDRALQERLHATALEALGEAHVCPGFDDLKRLDDFEAAAHEATRLKPIVPLLYFEPTTDVELGGIAVPAKTALFFVLRPAMLEERHFGDPHSYRPERWLTGHGELTHDARAYAQFGAGPRVCPGRHLAGVELRLVLSMLVRNFRVELAADPTTIREVMAFTMQPSAMPIRLSVRR